MTVQYSTSHRTNSMSDVVTACGATAYLLIYNGTIPVNCAASDGNTLLVALPLSNPIGSVTSGVLTFSAITSETATSGTATHFRIATSNAGTTVILQGSVGTSGADLNFSAGVTFTTGETISVSSFILTANGL